MTAGESLVTFLLPFSRSVIYTTLQVTYRIYSIKRPTLDRAPISDLLAAENVSRLSGARPQGGFQEFPNSPFEVQILQIRTARHFKKFFLL